MTRFGRPYVALAVAFVATGCGTLTGLDDVDPRPPPARSPSVAWMEGFGNAGDQVVTSVAVDDDGAIVIAGTFRGALDFGAETLASSGNPDVFVAKLDGAGAPVWARVFRSSDVASVARVRVTPQGDIVVSGWFGGTLDVGGVVFGAGVFANGFVAKLDPEGGIEWSSSFGGDHFPADHVVLPDGRIAVVGLGRRIDLSPATVLECHGVDALVFLLNEHGHAIGGACFGDDTDQFARAVVVDGDHLVVAGSFAGTMDLGGATLSSPDGERLFVAALDPDDLAPRWAGVLASPSATCFPTCEVALAPAPSGGVFLAAAYSGTADFGGGPLEGHPFPDVGVARYAEDGDLGGPRHLWSRRFGDSGEQRVYDAVSSPSGGLVVAGLMSGSLDLGGVGTLADSDLAKDPFVAAFAPDDGAPTWALQLHNDADPDDAAREASLGAHIALAPDGDAIVAASFRGTLRVGDRALVAPGSGYQIAVGRIHPAR